MGVLMNGWIVVFDDGKRVEMKSAKGRMDAIDKARVARTDAPSARVKEVVKRRQLGSLLAFRETRWRFQ